MPFPFDDYPWAKFEDLNIAYMIHRLGLIISEANAKLQELDAWKTATEQDLENWKDSTMDLIAEWEHDFMAEVNQWEHDTEQDLEQWKIDVLADLGTWKTNFETLFNQTFTDLAAIKTAAENARDAAAQSAAEAAQDAFELSNAIDNVSANTDAIHDMQGEIDGVSGLLDTQHPLVIGSSRKWTYGGTLPTMSSHVFVRINPGDVIKITGGSTAGYYAILQSDKTPEYDDTVDFSDAVAYNDRILMSANQDIPEFYAPVDAAVLYLTAVNNVGSIQLPSKLTINGIDRLFNIRRKIVEIQGEIDGADQRAIKIVSDKADKKALDLWGVRGSMGAMFTPVDLSSFAFLASIPVSVYSDGYQYKNLTDLEMLRNNGADVWPVETQTELNTALAQAASGSTIMLKKGLYTPITINKSLNLIGEDGTVFLPRKSAAFTPAGTPYVYRTANDSYPTSPATLLDISRLDEGIVNQLKKVVDPTTVVNTRNSWTWVTATHNLYVHFNNEEVVNADDIVILYDNDPEIIKVKGTSENASVFLKNITVLGGKANIWAEDATGYTSQKLVCKDLRAYFAIGGNGISLRGTDGFFQNCDIGGAKLDGINYHANTSTEYPAGDNTGTISNGLELECRCHDNGIFDSGTEYSDNGSSIHNNGKGVRVNGAYYNNKGGNIADTGDGTRSANFGCWAFDSTAPAGSNSADFWARGNMHMYLYGCRTGGNSQYNLMALDGATIHASRTEYSTHTGSIA